MSSPDWNPSLYLQFERQRTQPCFDLVARIPFKAPKNIVDLGCGPGNSTAVLADQFPDATISGIDSSPTMIEEAKRSTIRAAFSLGDISTYAPRADDFSPPNASALAQPLAAGERVPLPLDLIFSNAAFQWVPDHASLIPRLLSQLAPGSVLAIQIPHHTASPAHTLIVDAANAGRWRAKIGELRDPLVMHTPREYYDFASPLCATIDLWTTEYQHVMNSAADIVTWMSGTGLRPYLANLDEGEKAGFLAAYAERMAAAYPPSRDGRVLFPFNRLFMVAVRGGRLSAIEL